MEYGDGVLALGDCNGICGDFAEVASLAEHAGWARLMWCLRPLWMVLLLLVCPTQSNVGVGLLLTGMDTSSEEPKAIVVAAVGTGSSLVPDGLGKRERGRIYDRHRVSSDYFSDVGV